ncbi:MAG: class I SAM-dependent methyltransferase [Hyphomicrobiales bacterium]|nr:class I SAM-dependent methyltransferase [Hyphomicrobiales bacterium]
MSDETDKRRVSGSNSPHIVAVGEETRSSRRQSAPAAERNTGPILEVLKEHLPHAERALEVGSGTGQHVAAFAAALPATEWWPSDPDAQARESIAAWSDEAATSNIRPPLDLDVMRARWEAALETEFAAVLAINMIHISPWAATRGLIRGTGALLKRHGILYLYGPFRRAGAHTSQSNARFDEWLKSQNPEWGVRDMEDVEREAAAHALRLDAAVPMPANNFSLLFRKG